jgi:hypothetical protein
VGIHAGDVIARDGDFFGRTVNLASRIQGRAAAREVLVSRAVEAASTGEGFAFESLGPVALKGVATRVEVLRLVGARDHAAVGRQAGRDGPRETLDDGKPKRSWSMKTGQGQAIELPHLFGAEMHEEPYPVYQRLRETDPVHGDDTLHARFVGEVQHVTNRRSGAEFTCTR